MYIASFFPMTRRWKQLRHMIPWESFWQAGRKMCMARRRRSVIRAFFPPASRFWEFVMGASCWRIHWAGRFPMRPRANMERPRLPMNRVCCFRGWSSIRNVGWAIWIIFPRPRKASLFWRRRQTVPWPHLETMQRRFTASSSIRKSATLCRECRYWKISSMRSAARKGIGRWNPMRRRLWSRSAGR